MEMNKVYLGDCIEIMKNLPEKTVDLIFADPPFNIGIKYDIHNDNMSYDDYYHWSESWIKECFRLLKDNGSIYIAIGDEFAAEINIILKKQDLISAIGLFGIILLDKIKEKNLIGLIPIFCILQKVKNILFLMILKLEFLPHVNLFIKIKEQIL